MGDRGNIAIQNDGKRVWFYTHWRGSDMKEIVAAGLNKGRDRWTDGPYLARIIFDTLTGGDDGATGFGIDTEPGDNGHPFVIVDCDNQTVRLESDTREGFDILVKAEADLQPVAFNTWIEKYKQQD